jgi:pyruvate kinase
MIARGDLSIETPFTKVPVIQKQLIAKANQAAKPVITATQMLWSMIRSPNPTRAEVADVANAVFDGSDAVMLSDETTVGEHPIRAVVTMDSITSDSEQGGSDIGWEMVRFSEVQPMEPDEEMARSAVQLADRLGVDFISTITRSGRTARLVAKYRPRQKILAVTPNVKTYQRLSLIRGVVPLLIKSDSVNYDELMKKARALGRRIGLDNRQGIFVSKELIRRGTL